MSKVLNKMDIFFNTQYQNRTTYTKHRLYRIIHLLLFAGLSIFNLLVLNPNLQFYYFVLTLYLGPILFDLFYLLLRELMFHIIFITSNNIIRRIHSLFYCSQQGLDCIITYFIIVSRLAHLPIFLYTIVIFFEEIQDIQNIYIQNIFIVYSILCLLFYILYLLMLIVIIFNLFGLCRIARFISMIDYYRNTVIGYVDTLTINNIPIRIKIIYLSPIEYNKLIDCYICCEKKGNTTSNPCQHGDICLNCISRLEHCPQCRRRIEEIVISELSN